jgi:hypothetical protein
VGAATGQDAALVADACCKEPGMRDALENLTLVNLCDGFMFCVNPYDEFVDLCILDSDFLLCFL